METDRARLVEQALRDQIRVFHLLKPTVDQAWLQLDLTFSQIKGFFILGNRGPLTISGIASVLGIGRPAASLLVDRLFDLQLVERSEVQEDRRRTLVRLSPKGEELIGQIRQDGRARMLYWLNQLSDQDLDALTKGVGALLAVFDQLEESNSTEGHSGSLRNA